MNYELTAKVHKDSLVHYKGNKYSVPPKYIDKEVTLKRIENELHIYFNTDLISVHKINDKKINYAPNDYKELLNKVIKNKDELETVCLNNLSELDKLI